MSPYHLLPTIALSLNCLAAQISPPNILFICVDDLRPELSCYGGVALSPNLDKLASQASLFTHHYVQVPTSGASRASMLSGYLPKKNSDLSNEACRINFSQKPEQAQSESFFHALRRHGYYTVSVGKISHSPDGYIQKNGQSLQELPHSWDEALLDTGQWTTAQQAFFGYADGSDRESLKKEVKPYECKDVEDEVYLDGLSAQLAIQKLRELKARDQHFCLALGFVKPHLPFNAPKRYWDLYQEADINPSAYDIPQNTSKIGLHQSGEFNYYKQGEEKASLEQPLSDAYAIKLRHAYYASVSYVDAQIGKVLAELQALGLEQDTLIIVWGDHGWHLGDMRIWGKHTLMETALRSTLIIKPAGSQQGQKINRIVSAVDLYPTVMDLCHITGEAARDGHSLVPLLQNPQDSRWEDKALSFFKKGTTMRMPGYRLSRYQNEGQDIIELYAYGDEPQERENIATSRPDIVQQWLPILQKANFRDGYYSRPTP